MKLIIKSISSDNTERIAEQIGHNLSGNETIVLNSDLGGGKTVFVKGLARGAGSKDHVSSPTFTISKEYRASKFDLHHFDFYRLNEPGIISLELKEVLESENSVVVIEWAEIIKFFLPAKTLQVNIVQLGGDNRKLIFAYPKELSYLLKGVEA